MYGSVSDVSFETETFYHFIERFDDLKNSGVPVDLSICDLVQDVVHDEDFPKGNVPYDDYYEYLSKLSRHNALVMHAFERAYELYLSHRKVIR